MKRNFVYTAVSVCSRLLVGLLLFLLLARLWGAAQFGLFSFVFSFCALLVLLVDFGFALYLLREVAARPADAPRLIADGFRAKLLLVCVAVLLLVVALLVIGPKALPPSLVLPMFLTALAMSFADFFVAPLRALGRFDLEAIQVTVGNAAQFLLAGWVAWQGGSPVDVGWAMVISRVLYLGVAWRGLRSQVPGLRLRGVHVDAASPLVTLRRAWPYGIDGMLVTAWNQLDVLAVRILFGTQAVGLYSAGQKFVLGVSALAPVVGNVMIPRLSRLAAERSGSFGKLAMTTGGVLVAFSLLMAAPLIVLPKKVADLALGNDFGGIDVLLPFFGLVLVARFIGAGVGVIATAAGLQVKRVFAQFVGIAFAALSIGVVHRFHLSLEKFLLVIVAATLLTAAMNYLSVLRSGVLLARNK